MVNIVNECSDLGGSMRPPQEAIRCRKPRTISFPTSSDILRPQVSSNPSSVALNRQIRFLVNVVVLYKTGTFET